MIPQILTSQTFLESLFVLISTAILTGILVPYVKAKMDEGNFRGRRQFEENLARQSKLIEFQSTLLDEIGQSLWDYQGLALEPTYYKMRRNEDGYTHAIAEYDQKAPAQLADIRAQISKVKRFSKSDTYAMFHRLYYRELIFADVWLVELAENGESETGDWGEHHEYVYVSIGNSIDECLHQLALDFGLGGNQDSGAILPEIHEADDAEPIRI